MHCFWLNQYRTQFVNFLKMQYLLKVRCVSKYHFILNIGMLQRWPAYRLYDRRSYLFVTHKNHCVNMFFNDNANKYALIIRLLYSIVVDCGHNAQINHKIIHLISFIYFCFTGLWHWDARTETQL